MIACQDTTQAPDRTDSAIAPIPIRDVAVGRRGLRTDVDGSMGGADGFRPLRTAGSGCESRPGRTGTGRRGRPEVGERRLERTGLAIAGGRKRRPDRHARSGRVVGDSPQGPLAGA